MKLLFARLIASGLCSGFSPRSPGTCGSIAACLCWLALPSISNALAGVAVVVTGLGGFLASHIVMRDAPPDADPQWIVIDEWCGMFIALAVCPDKSGPWVGLAFILFRLFDISKIGPVGWAEGAPGAFGVMLDDIVAGLCAAASIAVIRLALAA